MARFIVPMQERTSLDAEPVGIGMGLKQRCVLSTGETVEPVKLDRRGLKRKQRVPARAGCASNIRRKKLESLQREYERAKIKEWNRLHEISAEIIKRHSRIIVEDLSIPNMVENRHLSRPISEQQWGATRRTTYLQG